LTTNAAVSSSMASSTVSGRQVLTERDGAWLAARQSCQRVVGDETGIGKDHVLAAVDVGLDGDVERLAPAGGGDEVVGVDREAVVASVLLADGLPECERSLVGSVGVDFARADGLDGRLACVVGRGEVRLAEAEVDRVLASGLEHLADTRDGDLFDPVCELCHTLVGGPGADNCWWSARRRSGRRGGGSRHLQTSEAQSGW
jgi:hypothetical protein